MNQTIVVNSFAQWRDAARGLLACNTRPEDVQWIESTGAGDLFGTHDAAGIRNEDTEVSGPAPRISREMMAMLSSAACYRAPDRWAFLYRVIWRWRNEDQAVASAADEDGARLHSMVKAIYREEHKMHAYLRFRERPESAGPPQFVAWFEPEHDVLPQVADHFARRMGRASWMIGTPQGTVLWDGKTLHAGPQVMAGPADIDDAGEALWLTYYRSIFNPARLNTLVMQGHIPSRYWKNLPEGKLVPTMISEATSGARRVGQIQAVGSRRGTSIPISAEQAQPDREQPSKLDECRRCDLWSNATQAVPGVGPPTARIMLVGEQPGDQEDLAGLPFVGPAGKLLDEVLERAGLDRKSVYLTNAVKHFKWEPRGKRRLHKTPGQREINACAYWLDHELEQVRPAVVVALGSTALKSVLRTSKASLTEMLGKPFRHGDRWIVAVYHPAYILRVPDENARMNGLKAMADGLRLAQQLAADQAAGREHG